MKKWDGKNFGGHRHIKICEVWRQTNGGEIKIKEMRNSIGRRKSKL